MFLLGLENVAGNRGKIALPTWSQDVVLYDLQVSTAEWSLCIKLVSKRNVILGNFSFDDCIDWSDVRNYMTMQTMEVDREERPQIFTIEWNMMDKQKFFPLSMLSTFTIRCLLYPFTVVKTRIQIQRQKSVYSGTLDAFSKILKYEGFSGLYKGFWINSLQIASGVFYVTTYETVRHVLAVKASMQSNRSKALIAGGVASVVGQTIIVPFDVISQHMMILGQLDHSKTRVRVVNPLNIQFETKSKLDIAVQITREVYRRDGLRGFYRGYFASLCTYVPNSACWWSFYHFYSDHLVLLVPAWIPHLVIQCIAAPLSGVTSSLITNPLDIVRARLQVQRSNSFSATSRLLWQEEGLGIFTKGLSARLVQSIAFSFMIILGYETIKRWSVREEYKHHVRW